MEELQDVMQTNGVEIAELKGDVEILAHALPLLPNFCSRCHSRVCPLCVFDVCSPPAQIMRDPDGFFCASGRSYAADIAETMDVFRQERINGRANLTQRRLRMERYVGEFRPLYNRCVRTAVLPRPSSRHRGVSMEDFDEATGQFSWVQLLAAVLLPSGTKHRTPSPNVLYAQLLAMCPAEVCPPPPPPWPRSPWLHLPSLRVEYEDDLERQRSEEVSA
jgi:hypothetical protein